MVEVKVDPKLISKLNEASQKDKKAKELFDKFNKAVKKYIVVAATEEHFVEVEDKEKFSELLEEIENYLKKR